MGLIFRQLWHHETYTFTYLVGCSETGEAALIDPVQSETQRYLTLLSELNLRLVKALDTHVHADHITALGDLREHTGCITMMGHSSKAQCVSTHFHDKEHIAIGHQVLIAIYTPGHTDDSYCLKMKDRIFTGDTLLIRGTGRTDFQNGDPATEYDSIFQRLLTLPEQTWVYPGHDYKGWTVSTIGEEKKFNPRLQIQTKADFIALMNNLNLPDPKFMDVAVPANLKCGAILPQ